MSKAPSASEAARSSKRMAWPAIVAAGMLGQSIILRSRLRTVGALAESEEPISREHRFLSVRGVQIDDATRRAASAFARHEGLEVVDLVPADLPVDQALEFLRGADPVRLRTNRLREGRGAYQALLVDADVLRRAEIEASSDLDPPAIAEITIKLKRYACSSFGVAIAPGLHATGEQPASRADLLAAIHDGADGLTLRLAGGAAAQAVALRALATGSRRSAAAFGLICVHPLLVFAGTELRPRDLATRALQPWRGVLRWASTVVSALKRPVETGPRPDDVAFYAEKLARGAERLLEPRREECPWCGGNGLTVHLRVPDLMQHKPGSFTLERCQGCGVIFQNPRLTLEGLELYYRDYYDGLGGRMAGLIFDSQAPSYEARARLVARFTTPSAWLDVGGGHGHFCNKAREILPSTSFEALDIGEGVEEAARRRWVDRAHRGLFPQMVEELAGRFDVVSMHHYLEHTREPLEELDAAARVLRPGDLLLIEMPNPESWLGRLLGRRWLPWFQPQHQHMIPRRRLVEALKNRGFEVVATEVGPAHQPVDLTGAAALGMWALAPNPRLPWMPQPHRRVRSWWHAFVVVASIVPIAVGFVLDQIAAPAIRRGSLSNAYRVLARRLPDAQATS